MCNKKIITRVFLRTKIIREFTGAMKMIRTMSRSLAVATVAAAILLHGSYSMAASNHQPAPNAQEQTVLEKYPSYTGEINVIDLNEDQAIHKFLKENDGKTVYVESAILRYEFLPAELKKTDDIPPTDRFDNKVFQSCWKGMNKEHGSIDFGKTGVPLPVDQQDVDAACQYRIAVVMQDGLASKFAVANYGMDKFETFFDGFFTISSSEIDGGKTLYTLTQVDTPEENALALFRTYKKNKGRQPKKLWVEPASGE